MATWNNPLDVTTGDNLTATLWNNLLGANGSLKYLYDYFSPRNVVLWKSTDTAVSATTSTNISFDTVVNSFASMQQNFPVTVPITAIPIPVEGIYSATFLHAYSSSTAANGSVSLKVSSGATTFNYQSAHRDLSNSFGVYCTTFTFYAMPSATVTVNVYYTLSRNILARPVDDVNGTSHLLIISKVN